MKKLNLFAAAALVGAFLLTGTLSAQDGAKKEVKQDKKEVKADKKEVKAEKKEVKGAKKEAKAEKK